MSQFKSNRMITCVSGGAFNKGARLKFGVNTALYAASAYQGDGLVVEVCGASDKSSLTAMRETFAAGEFVSCVLGQGGTSYCIASGPIAAGAEIFAAANGKVASSGSVFEGIALEAATANNDVIECMLPAMV